MPTRDEVRQELVDFFPQAFAAEGTSRQMLEPCVEVAVFLADVGRTKPFLSELDRRMQQACGTSVRDVESYYQNLYEHYVADIEYKKESPKLLKKIKYKSKSAQDKLDDLEKNTSARLSRPVKPGPKHVLTSVLAEVETKAGFGSLHEEGKVDLLLGFQESGSFRKRITLRRHFKDPSVPGYHGEHTHRLQWALVALAGFVDDVAALYAFIGSVVYEKDDTRGLWDAIVDRDGGEANFVPFKADQKVKADFRSPERLTQFVVDAVNRNDFPLLHVYIMARIRKRWAMGDSFTRYARRKLFGTRQPTPEEEEKLSEYIKTGYIPAEALP